MSDVYPLIEYGEDLISHPGIVEFDHEQLYAWLDAADIPRDTMEGLKIVLTGQLHSKCRGIYRWMSQTATIYVPNCVNDAKYAESSPEVTLSQVAIHEITHHVYPMLGYVSLCMGAAGAAGGWVGVGGFYNAIVSAPVTERIVWAAVTAGIGAAVTGASYSRLRAPFRDRPIERQAYEMEERFGDYRLVRYTPFVKETT